jgi:peptidoglycan-associated lipoprotein
MRRIEALAMLLVPMAVSCSHAKPQAVTEPPPAAVAQAPAPAAQAPAAEEAPLRGCTTDAECRGDELCVASRCQPIVAGMPECARASAHFDFDEATLRDADAPTLRRLARCLQALPAGRALVEGHADERGTVQYNVALGFRRAASIERYLAALGVPRDRLDTVSYGEERPVCEEPREECWARNRRADVAAAGAPGGSRPPAR